MLNGLVDVHTNKQPHAVSTGALPEALHPNLDHQPIRSLWMVVELGNRIFGSEGFTFGITSFTVSGVELR